MGNATNMISKVASHVVGADEVPLAGGKAHQQMEALKVQVIAAAGENDVLLSQVRPSNAGSCALM